MANQANSRADDLMVGAGTLFFKRSDDPHGLHHLGNVEEFNITTDVTTVEKNSSMDKDRELMASVVTAVNPTGSLTMNEYNPYNLALGLYGREGVMTQSGGAFTNVAYTVTSVPGVIELRDANGNRYMDVSGVSIGLSSATAATLEFDPTSLSPNLVINATAPTVNTVVNAVQQSGSSSGVGSITLDMGSYNGTNAETIMLQIDSVSGVIPGSLDGMAVDIMFNGLVDHVIVPSGTGNSFQYNLGATGMSITFGVGTNSSTDTEPAFVAGGGWSTIKYQPSTSSGVDGVDYIATEHMLRAGIIQIPHGSSFQAGDQVFINYTVPEGKYVTVSGADAGEIEGQLLFIGDPNIGGRYNIEGWKVKVTPDGDLTGLISDDFGSFTLNVRFLADKQGHPDAPYFRATMIGRADGASAKSGVYDPEY